MGVCSSLFIIHYPEAMTQQSGVAVMLDTKKPMNERSSSTTEMIVHGNTIRFVDTE